MLRPLTLATHPDLVVGLQTSDDAAVYDLGDGRALISTTDFFMPIVDDPFSFGRIAATNAISDVYAMGGTPLLAIAILGWPVNQLPPDVAGQVLAGGRAAQVGWTAVIAFHVLLMLFGWWVWAWSLPALAVLVTLARHDLGRTGAPS